MKRSSTGAIAALASIGGLGSHDFNFAHSPQHSTYTRINRNLKRTQPHLSAGAHDKLAGQIYNGLRGHWVKVEPSRRFVPTGQGHRRRYWAPMKRRCRL